MKQFNARISLYIPLLSLAFISINGCDSAETNDRLGVKESTSTGGSTATGGTKASKATGGKSPTGGTTAKSTTSISSSTASVGGTSAISGSSTGGTIASNAMGGSSAVITTTMTSVGGIPAVGGSNATGGKSSTGGTIATGGTIPYSPCSCEPYLHQNDAGVPDGGVGGTTSTDMIFEAWSTSDRSDLITGTLENVYSRPYPANSYLGPALPDDGFTIAPANAVERTIRIGAVFCGETYNKPLAGDPILTLYFFDGTSVAGSILSDQQLFVKDDKTTINVFEPYGLTGGIPIRICFLNKGGPS